jgi:hypothetical protein
MRGEELLAAPRRGGWREQRWCRQRFPLPRLGPWEPWIRLREARTRGYRTERKKAIEQGRRAAVIESLSCSIF